MNIFSKYLALATLTLAGTSISALDLASCAEWIKNNPKTYWAAAAAVTCLAGAMGYYTPVGVDKNQEISNLIFNKLGTAQNNAHTFDAPVWQEEKAYWETVSKVHKFRIKKQGGPISEEENGTYEEFCNTIGNNHYDDICFNNYRVPRAQMYLVGTALSAIALFICAVLPSPQS